MKLYQKIKKIIKIIIITYICAFIFITPFREKVTLIAMNNIYNCFDRIMNEEDRKSDKESQKYISMNFNTSHLKWSEKFEIKGTILDEDLRLVFHKSNQSSPIILDKLTNYKEYNNKLFAVSKDGYAVVENDILKALITSPDKQFISSHIKDDSIKYLNNFNEFSKNELKILKELTEESFKPYFSYRICENIFKNT